MLLIFAALATMILVGCGGSSQPFAERQAPRTAGSSGQKAEGAGSSGQASGERPGHPALGSADAPVVLTEYGDYQ